MRSGYHRAVRDSPTQIQEDAEPTEGSCGNLARSAGVADRSRPAYSTNAIFRESDIHRFLTGRKNLMSSRRRFLQQASSAGLALTSSTLFGRLLSAQSPATADQTTRIFMNSRRTIAPLDRNLFGSFLEHLGRAIYEGIYEPG